MTISPVSLWKDAVGRIQFEALFVVFGRLELLTSERRNVL
jgi:hypothetical protein